MSGLKWPISIVTPSICVEIDISDWSALAGIMDPLIINQRFPCDHLRAIASSALTDNGKRTVLPLATQMLFALLNKECWHMDPLMSPLAHTSCLNPGPLKTAEAALAKGVRAHFPYSSWTVVQSHKGESVPLRLI